MYENYRFIGTLLTAGKCIIHRIVVGGQDGPFGSEARHVGLVVHISVCGENKNCRCSNTPPPIGGGREGPLGQGLHDTDTTRPAFRKFRNRIAKSLRTCAFNQTSRKDDITISSDIPEITALSTTTQLHSFVGYTNINFHQVLSVQMGSYTVHLE